MSSTGTPVTKQEMSCSPASQYPRHNTYIHGLFMAAHLSDLPKTYSSLRSIRATVLHFAVTGLDMLRQLDTHLPVGPSRSAIIDWVYGLQLPTGGFVGSPHDALPDSSPPSCDCTALPAASPAHAPLAHLPSSYSCISVLLALGDDLSRVRVRPLLRLLCQTHLTPRRLAQAGYEPISVSKPTDGYHHPVSGSVVEAAKLGSFAASLLRDEADCRFMYCAAAVPALLHAHAQREGPHAVEQLFADAHAVRTELDGNDEAYVGGLGSSDRCSVAALLRVLYDCPAAARHLARCQSWDGAFGLYPGAEGHGGATYTSVASALLMGTPQAIPRREDLVRWVVMSQGRGFCGRINKPRDCCYSFWVGAAARLLGVASFLSTNNVGFIALCEGNKAGFGKEPGAGAEILHSFYACAGLSLESADTPKGSRTEEDELIDGGWTNLEPIHPLLGITCRSLSIPLTVSTLFERE